MADNFFLWNQSSMAAFSGSGSGTLVLEHKPSAAGERSAECFGVDLKLRMEKLSTATSANGAAVGRFVHGPRESCGQTFQTHLTTGIAEETEPGSWIRTFAIVIPKRGGVRDNPPWQRRAKRVPSPINRLRNDKAEEICHITRHFDSTLNQGRCPFRDVLRSSGSERTQRTGRRPCFFSTLFSWV